MESKNKSKAQHCDGMTVSGIATPDLLYGKHINELGEYTQLNRVLYRWVGSHWEAIHHDDARDMAWEWLTTKFPDKATTGRAADCANAAIASLKKRPVPALGRSDVYVPLRNAWLRIDVESGEIRVVAPDKSKGVTHCVNIECDIPHGQPFQVKPLREGLFQRFLDTSLPDLEDRRMVQEFLGYSLIPAGSLQLQRALWLIGEGSNGKSVLRALIAAFHPSHVSMNLARLDGFGLERLVGASLATVDEAPKRGIDEETLKTLISGGEIQADRKHVAAITFKPTARWIICSNNPPQWGDKSDGISRRFHFIRWTAKVSEAAMIENLAEKILESEMDVVLDWLLAGVLSLLTEGKAKFRESASSCRTRSEMQVETDSFEAWRAERSPAVDLGEKPAPAFKSDVYRDYADFCKDSNCGAEKAESFWRRMRKQFPKMCDMGKLVLHDGLGKPLKNAQGKYIRGGCVNILLDTVDTSATPVSEDEAKANALLLEAQGRDEIESSAAKMVPPLQMWRAVGTTRLLAVSKGVRHTRRANIEPHQAAREVVEKLRHESCGGGKAPQEPLSADEMEWFERVVTECFEASNVFPD